MESIEVLRTTQQRNAQKALGAATQSARFAILAIAPNFEQIVMSLPDYASDVAMQTTQDPATGLFYYMADFDPIDSAPIQ